MVFLRLFLFREKKKKAPQKEKPKEEGYDPYIKGGKCDTIEKRSGDALIFRGGVV